MFKFSYWNRLTNNHLQNWHRLEINWSDGPQCMIIMLTVVKRSPQCYLKPYSFRKLLPFQAVKSASLQIFKDLEGFLWGTFPYWTLRMGCFHKYNSVKSAKHVNYVTSFFHCSCFLLKTVPHTWAQVYPTQPEGIWQGKLLNIKTNDSS